MNIIATILCLHFGILITFCLKIYFARAELFPLPENLPTNFYFPNLSRSCCSYCHIRKPEPRTLYISLNILPQRIPSTCSATTFFKKYLSTMGAWVCCKCSDRNDSGTYCVSCGHFVCMNCYTVYGNKRSKPSAAFEKCAQEYGYQQSREELKNELQKLNGLSTLSTSEKISPKHEQLMELLQSNRLDVFDEKSIGGMDKFQ